MAATSNSPLHLTSGDVKCALAVDSTQLASLIGHRDAFQASLPSDDTPPSSPAELALRFVAYLESAAAPASTLTAALTAFEQQFLSTTDIHSLALSSQGGVQAGRDLLRSYYDALSRSSRQPTPTPSALLQAAAAGSKQLHLIFGGQGAANPACFQELRSLVSTYSPLLSTLLSTASAELSALSRAAATHGFYAGREIDLAAWLADDSLVPDSHFLASAAVSFPIIGLVGLAHYCVTCRVLDKTPGGLRGLLRGVTGHSQGLVVAAAVAQCETWDDFYAAARDAVRLLFWIGFESHDAAPRSSLSAADVQDSVDAGEGRPGMMLSVRGLRQGDVEKLVAKCNAQLPDNAKVYIALKNTPENFTLSGPARSLRGVCLHVRSVAAEDGVDQARVPFRRRKKAIRASFLPISAPFHSPYLAAAAARVKERMAGCGLSTAKMGLPVHHSKDGQDLRGMEGVSATDILVDAIALDFVDWPAALALPGATHVVTLASGRLGDVVDMVKQGQGVIVVNAATLAAPDDSQCTKADLFAPRLPEAKLHAASWAQLYGPRLAKDGSGVVQLDTRLSRVLGAPPVFTAGMTPTTVHWDFVAAVMKAGYHVEMAGGGYFEPKSMGDAIERAARAVPGGRGVSVNLIYASPEAMRWQIGLLRDLQRKGVPVDGLTIGAGVPSPEIASEYITTLGLKHVGFKPGSVQAIRDTLAIADAHPRFPVILQWTGGRGGGHHSYEDFHEPILDLYPDIRRRQNVVLVAGSGFGDAEGVFPYLTGEWAQTLYGRAAAMPFDGVLLGSRMMVAKEAHTSPESRALIVAAPGLATESDWDKTYEGAGAGGVLTVQSEMGQPIHKLATRGVRLWAELDRSVFSLPRAQRAAALAKMRDALIPRLNADFAKPWFAVGEAGTPAADVADMTYALVLSRLLQLTYLPHRAAFIDPSYAALLRDVMQRAVDRLNPTAKAALPKASETDALVAATRDAGAVAAWCPGAATRKLHPEDARWFVRRCKSRVMKPVNFIPALDEDFEYFFKKDSLWQSENVDAVVGKDAERVCILQSPVSVRYSQRADESAKEILDGITGGLVEMVKKAFYPADADIPLAEAQDGSVAAAAQEVLPGVQLTTDAGKQMFQLASGHTVAADEWLGFMAGRTGGWMRRLFADGYVVEDHVRTANPFHRILHLRPGETLALDPQNETISIASAATGRPLCTVAQVHGPRVRATMWAPSGANDDVGYALEYVYLPGKHCSLFSDSEAHNLAVKDFYRRLWLPNTDLTDKTVRSTFAGPERVVSEQSVRDLAYCVHAALPDLELAIPSAGDVPLDLCIVLAWEPLVAPLMLPEVQGDLLRLVHRSNKFEHLSDARLKVGDVVTAASTVQAVTIEKSGRSVVVRAVLSRAGVPVVAVTSDFLFKGAFADFDSTFRRTTHPPMQLRLPTAIDEAVLKAQPWFELADTTAPLANRTLTFALESAVTWRDRTTLATLSTTGAVTDASSGARLATVSCAASDCHGDPVLDYLARKAATAVGAPVPLAAPGWLDEGETSKELRVPPTNARYAALSADTNPIHVAPVFAAYAGLPGTITHGMYTSAVVRAVLQHLAADGDAARFRSWEAKFVGMVLPGDRVKVRFAHAAMAGGRMVVKVTALNAETEEPVLEGEAEVEQVRTAYVFTGQGSQAVGMGMGLYAESEVARRVWDEVDKALRETYGWSILDIVRTNPTSLTISFGGPKGHRIRQNYLAMTIEKMLPDGRTVTEPMLKDLTPDSPSYTFHEPRGLLFSTQFAQPAILLQEMATFLDMRQRGLVQEGAPFAGHSLGEYGALAALADFLPVETLVRVIFYRGLTMQVAMERDQFGRTEYGMAAANPGRVGRWFGEEMLKDVVGMIAETSGSLLEIVNLNVEGEQYVCAGKLENLHALATILTHLARSKDSPASLFTATPTNRAALQSLVAAHVGAAAALARPIDLERGAATIPLKGIDVPFHSSHLLHGVQPYRNFLRRSIAAADVDPARLVGRYVPNVTAKPFSLDEEYVRLVLGATGSPVLGRLVGRVAEVVGA
ncbi:hypothetical protein SLS58_010754 [Diplodia intermedia]|uniref:Malonyl-CoA:ACP transacylase (MAT) domain-containing protein n=1 Tax=Diplodia intermedia TaxID=856260 RepID=A0ABR3T3S7_9PEZI